MVSRRCDVLKGTRPIKIALYYSLGREVSVRRYLGIPVRLLLPALNVLIAVGLLRMGYQEAQQAHQEPLPMLERARYVDYALNIPAWAAQSVTPWMLHINKGVTYWKAMETERDWWYLLYVILMWYYIGLRLDRHKTGNVVSEHKKRNLWTVLGRVFLVLYGIFICFRAFTIPWYLEPWFIVAAIGWGVALIIGNLYFLLRRPSGGISMVTPPT